MCVGYVHTVAPFTVVPQELLSFTCVEHLKLHLCMLLWVWVYYNVHLGTQRSPFQQIFMVFWQSPDTPVISCFHVSAASSVLEPCALLSACFVSCWSVVFRSRHSCLEFRFRVGVQTLALHVLSLCVSVLLSTCVLLCCTQFVFLSAACIHVIYCAVWHAACEFHWLHAFTCCHVLCEHVAYEFSH